MRIAIDATSISTKNGSRGAGVGHYTFEATRALLEASSRNSYTVFLPASLRKQDEEELLKGITWAKAVRLPRVKIPGVTRHLLMPAMAKLRRAELFWAPSGELPLGWKGKSVVSVHDVSVFTHPEWFPDEDRGNLSRRVIFPRSMKQATRIAAVSAFTKVELESRFPVARGKMTVIPEGVRVPEGVRAPDTDERERWGLAEDTVLFLGTLEPRKNLERALLAFDRYLRSHPDRAPMTRFILAGASGWKSDGIVAEMERVNAAWRKVVPNGVVHGTGYVTEEEKWILLAHASCFLFPSLEEGFGLPALEALACGTPVIASNRGSLPEVLGDAALYVDAEDSDAMALSLAQVLLMPEAMRDIRRAGVMRAKPFTWRATAEGLLRLFEDVN